MLAHQLVGKEALALRDVEAPRAGSVEVQVRVRAAGVCETDVRLYHIGGEPYGLPRTLGHEFSGEVTEVGRAVVGVSPGERVVVDPVFGCDACRFCRAGRPNVCVDLRHLGQQIDGSFAEYVVAPAANVYRLPDAASFVAGALAEPFACALHGLNRSRLQAGEDVLIVGDGFFGMVYAQLARALGARRVVVLGHHEDRLARAREQGADVAVDGRSPEVREIAGAMGDGLGPPVVVDTVGTFGSLGLALDLAAYTGRVTIFGAPKGVLPRVEPADILEKELDVFGSRSGLGAWSDVTALMAQGRIKPERLVSGVLPLADLARAFDLKASRASDVVKLVVT